MQKQVPLHKQSKKARRAYYSCRRGSWCGICPVTRAVPNGKAYNRRKEKHHRETEAYR